MYTEDELRPISALQHVVFCERRCALVHIERVWAENTYTTEGALLHECVHEPASKASGELRRVNGLPVHSMRYGLVGQCDVVEFRRTAETTSEVAYPVEFKRGTEKRGECDDVQLCAQAFCLEEMLGGSVLAGAVYYGGSRRRREVPFTSGLRRRTEGAITRLHELLVGQETPPARIEKKCSSCSLNEYCLPQAQASKVAAIVQSIFKTTSP